MPQVQPSSSEQVSGLHRKPRRAHASPTRISEADEARLTLYLGELGTRFERSVSGRILEIQEQFGAFSARCRRCKGSGIVEGADAFSVLLEEVQRTRQSSTQRRSIEAIPDETTRWEERERKAKDAPPLLRKGEDGELREWRGGWCPQCRGTGAVPKLESGPPRCERCDGRGRVAAFNVAPGGHDRPCRECLSTGRAIPTVQLMGAVDHSGTNMQAESNLALYAITSRQLGAVRERSDVCARAIELLFGDQGARWARTAHGRLFALYQETPAGKRLARWADERVAREYAAQMAKLKGAKRPAKKGGAATWVNPRPVVGEVAFAGLAEAATAVQELWERQWRQEKRRAELGARGGWLDPSVVHASQHEAPRPPIDLMASERLESEVDEERRHPDPFRRKHLLLAAEQARQLYLRASKLWVFVGAIVGRPSKRELEREKEDREAVVRVHAKLVERGHDSAANYIATQAVK